MRPSRLVEKFFESQNAYTCSKIIIAKSASYSHQIEVNGMAAVRACDPHLAALILAFEA